MDNKAEILPIVDENGTTIGSMTRQKAHDGSKILHPVVHLHVFSSKEELYLQKRPEWKDIQPGKWDTAVGGHVGFGESIEDALARETYEEIGISGFCPQEVVRYVFESSKERELVHVYRTTYDGEITSSKVELDGGRFWKITEIVANMGKGIFTPNFEHEFKKYFLKELVK